MFRRIGFDLRAIQRDVAELTSPAVLLQNLEEQLAERLQMALAEVADRSEVSGSSATIITKSFRS